MSYNSIFVINFIYYGMKNIINIVKNQIKNRGSPNSSIQKKSIIYDNNFVIKDSIKNQR